MATRVSVPFTEGCYYGKEEGQTRNWLIIAALSQELIVSAKCAMKKKKDEKRTKRDS
jgi:hypothetical protein